MKTKQSNTEFKKSLTSYTSKIYLSYLTSMAVLFWLLIKYPDQQLNIISEIYLMFFRNISQQGLQDIYING